MLSLVVDMYHISHDTRSLSRARARAHARSLSGVCMETQHSTPLESVREGSSDGVSSSSSSLALADLVDEGGPQAQVELVLAAGTEQDAPANVREGGQEECTGCTGAGGHGSSQMVHDYLGDRCVCVCVCPCAGVHARMCICMLVGKALGGMWVPPSENLVPLPAAPCTCACLCERTRARVGGNVVSGCGQSS